MALRTLVGQFAPGGPITIHRLGPSVPDLTVPVSAAGAFLVQLPVPDDAAQTYYYQFLQSGQEVARLTAQAGSGPLVVGTLTHIDLRTDV